MRKATLIFVLLITVIFVGAVATSTVRGERIEIPGGVFYYQPAASVFGSEATWVNPAALARYRVLGFQFMADYYDGNYAKSWGSVLSREALSIGYRTLHNPDGDNYKEYILAGSVPVGRQLSFGASYRYFTDGPGIYDNRHFWNLGLLYQPDKRFSWAAVFSNLNRGKIDGVRTETEQRYSFAYRPLKDEITLAVDMFLSTKTRLSNADFVYQVEVTPLKGLYLNALIDDDRNFEIGVRANLLQYFVGSRRQSDSDGNHKGSTVFFGATSSRQPSIIEPKAKRLSVSLAGRPSENPPRPIIGKKQTSFLTTLLSIYRAAEDPYVGEMVLALDRLALGFGQAQELREAVKFFRGKGKAVTCHISYPNNIAYYIGSACDRILIPPVSQLNLVGLRAELTFYGGTLEKIGVRADLLRIGDYKSGAEPYTQTAASEENRQQVNRLLDDLFDQFVSGIAEGRAITIDSVKKLIDNGPFTSAQALEYGLVDGLSYRDELNSGVLTKMPEISLRKYVSDTVINDIWGVKPAIAVVVAEGDVAFDGEGVIPFEAESDVTPRKMAGAFTRTRKDQTIKGIIFRINSPGGFALAGEDVYREVERAADDKPMVVSMANVAASGGYYIAMPAKYLFANPASITGSIGIYGGKADLSGLYEKIGMGKELFVRGRFAGMLTTMRPFTPEEREKYFSSMNAMYQHFLELVSDNRNMSVDSVDNLSRGRVWTGREALGNGLVDRAGGIKQAIDFTAERVGLKDYRIEILPDKRPFIILPGISVLGDISRLLGLGGARASEPGEDPSILATEGILARLPFDIEIE
ncbi:MAG: signal peptide peptidase SppA [Candidatus Zixiibacteriota bacterium]